ncbi:MAG: TetR/AcrR family transcriptional regulator [Candidatus Hydrogenedentes bacterium]|nr:TetR/AcrR family transcriptional regulator [Candidatus Hydrogenedentota bacterium]
MNDTRQRLLDSACIVFSEKGFRLANVSDICKRADANIAAVNYHFGGKKKLYEEVLRYASARADERFPLLSDASEVPCPRERIARFVKAQFQRTFCTGLEGCFQKLLVHEMTTPTFAHESVFRDLIRREIRFLHGVVRELLPPDATDLHVRVCSHSVVSLCAFLQFNRARRERIMRRAQSSEDLAEEMARPATLFAWAGIDAVRQDLEQETNRVPDGAPE